MGLAMGQGDGGKDLAEDHAADNEPHRPLRVLGEKGPEQSQHRPGPDELFADLGECGGADTARAIEGVFVDVLQPRQQNAGQQQKDPQPGPCVPQ